MFPGRTFVAKPPVTEGTLLVNLAPDDCDFIQTAEEVIISAGMGISLLLVIFN